MLRWTNAVRSSAGSFAGITWRGSAPAERTKSSRFSMGGAAGRRAGEGPGGGAGATNQRRRRPGGRAVWTRPPPQPAAPAVLFGIEPGRVPNRHTAEVRATRIGVAHALHDGE